MDDVNRNIGDLGEGDGAVRRLGFSPRGTRQRVVFGRGVAFGQRPLHQHVDDVAVLRVHADGAAVLPRPQQRLENAAIVQHEDAAVGHEQLERRDPFAHERVHLALGLVVQVGHDHVKAVVDGRLALGFLHPRFPGLVQRLPPELNGEVDDGGGAAERRGHRAGFEIVRRVRAAERHVEVGVDVNAAGQDVLARRVDHAVGGHLQPGANQRDLLIFDDQIAVVLIDGRDDGSVLDQCAHFNRSGGLRPADPPRLRSRGPVAPLRSRGRACGAP